MTRHSLRGELSGFCDILSRELLIVSLFFLPLEH